MLETLLAIHNTGLNIAECVINNNAVRDDSFSMDTQYFEKLTFVTPRHPLMCVLGGKNVSFSESLAYVLNEWTLIDMNFATI